MGILNAVQMQFFLLKEKVIKKTDFSWKDSLEVLSFIGSWRLFINHWKFGLKEYKRSFSKVLFLKELQKMIPTLKIEDIIVGRSGVRAMALCNDGEIIDDFKIVQNKNNLHILNAPSPAATACLAIGQQIMEKAKLQFNFKN